MSGVREVMRKMNRKYVSEWGFGEPLERVDFGNGITGMNRSIPQGKGLIGDFERLTWKCAAVKADGGPELEVTFTDDSCNGERLSGYFDVWHDGSNGGAYTYEQAWLYINGIERGWRMARKCHRSGLYDTLRTFCKGMSGSSAHRQKKQTGPGPLVKYSMVSVGANTSGSGVRSRKAGELSHSTDSTYTLREPSMRTRRIAPRTHSASENGGLLNSARCMSVCSRRRLISFRRSLSRFLAEWCSMIQPMTLTARVSRNAASSMPCSANQSEKPIRTILSEVTA